MFFAPNFDSACIRLVGSCVWSVALATSPNLFINVKTDAYSLTIHIG